MTRHRTITGVLLAAVALLNSSAGGQDDLTRRATWDVPAADEVKARLEAWLDGREASDEQRAQVEALWEDVGQPEGAEGSILLSRLAESAAVVWPEARPMTELVQQTQVQFPLPTFEILAVAEEEAAPAQAAAGEPAANDTDAWMRDNLRLVYARWLAQHELYDESLALIASLEPGDVVDPASLLFYKSAAHHFLLNKVEGLATIEKLLENEESIARRYAITAKLMAADLKPLETDSLDEVSRMMGDIERRLRLQRAGKRVRQEEDDVVAKLDKMIEELEQQQQQQQQSAGAAGNSNAPSQPMQDSNPGGASGEGNVDPKHLAAGESWGNLPPKERQEALQLITKELPAHYREAVEEYLRKLARDGVNP